MHITVTVPSGLTVISNGQFLGKKTLPGNQEEFKWAVSYPMNNYSAVLYIGDYVHFSDQFVSSFRKFSIELLLFVLPSGFRQKICSTG